MKEHTQTRIEREYTFPTFQVRDRLGLGGVIIDVKFRDGHIVFTTVSPLEDGFYKREGFGKGELLD